MSLVMVAVGSAVGAILRLAVVELIDRRLGPVPWGTVLVNVVGSLGLGLLVGAGAVPHLVMAVLGVGLCGALTTYSSFALETVQLVGEGHRPPAAINVAATLVLGVGAGVVGFLIATAHIGQP